jgi:6-oxo-cyclohex-1-ene-carbonyl-CoA hydrolase
MERGMWNCISCEMWSAYKMQMVGMITKAVPVLKVNGEFIPNPAVITDRMVENGQIVYGENKTGEEAAAAKALIKTAEVDFSLLDAEVEKLVWTFTNLFPNCLQLSIDMMRQKKKFFWDMNKLAYRHWLGTNMSSEAYLGFNAFATKKLTGKDTIDFIKYRQMLAEAHVFDQELIDAVLGPRK